MAACNIRAHRTQDSRIRTYLTLIDIEPGGSGRAQKGQGDRSMNLAEEESAPVVEPLSRIRNEEAVFLFGDGNPR
jgi:hypothetical protein